MAPGTSLRFDHRGVKLPESMAFLGRRYFNLQHRLNRFRLMLPITQESPPTPVKDAFMVRARLRATGRERFPAFLTLSSGLLA